MKKINYPVLRDKHRFVNRKYRRLNGENDTMVVVIIERCAAVNRFDVLRINMRVQFMQPLFRNQRNAEYRKQKCRNELTLQLHVVFTKLTNIQTGNV